MLDVKNSAEGMVMTWWQDLLNAIFRRKDISGPPRQSPGQPAPGPRPKPENPAPPRPPQPRAEAPSQPPAAPPPPAPPPPAPPPPAPPPPAPPVAQPVPLAPSGPRPLISFGCTDPNVTDAQCNAWFGEIEKITRVPYAQIVDGPDKPRPTPMQPLDAEHMTIAQVQQGLKEIGFFPGGRVDGICGYRTQSAIRLFQEYVRTIEGAVAMIPDGRFGPITQDHLRRWMANGLRPDWKGDAGEHDAWLDLLQKFKQHRLASPGPFLEKVNAFTGKTDTRKVADWSYSDPNAVHLIGVRRKEFGEHFDDIFVLLINGMVFKFQGSTEPGISENAEGRPFLAPGQHAYHFGLHQRTYLALRPIGMNSGSGVLVLRSGADGRIDPADFAKPLQANGTINIHWAGIGGEGSLNYTKKDGSRLGWSEGCQVITGAFYINPANQLQDCRAFAARNNGDVKSNPQKTRGAYNVALDLVTAASGGLSSDAVLYTLLEESDLDLVPALRDKLQDARNRVMAKVRPGA
jgi:hypothetical protein